MTIDPAQHDAFEIFIGASFNENIFWSDDTGTAIDLTGYSAAMEARYQYDCPPVLSLTTTDGTIVINGTLGQLALSLDPVQTAVLPVGRYIYDVRLTSPGGEVDYILNGTITIQQMVTR